MDEDKKKTSRKKPVKEKVVNFGFEQVAPEEKRSKVDELFSDVAGKYDLMNDLMSLGIHRLWKDQFCKYVPESARAIIDVAGGTGDIAFRLHKTARSANKERIVTICDINPEMLEVCRDRAVDENMLAGLEFVVADAEKLPFADQSFDCYTIAFGIRNVLSIENVLKEAFRVLKTGGKFLCLEFSHIEPAFARPFYDFYSFNIIPAIGKFITGNEPAYRYLAESIKIFPKQEDFKNMIVDAGFSRVGYTNLNFGVVAIHYGYKE